MKDQKLSLVAGIVMILITLTVSPAARYVSGDLIIKFEPGQIEVTGVERVPISQVTINNPELAAALQGYVTRTVERVFKYCDDTSHLSMVYALKMDRNLDMENVAGELMDLNGVIYAGPNYVGVFFSTPNDPDFNLQWGLNNTQPGQWDINAPEAWDIQTGNRSVMLAVVDAGLAPEHYSAPETEFYGRIFENPPNTYLWDGPYGTDDIRTGVYAGHGTHVTGIATAATNDGNSPWNGHGMAGVAGGWNGGAVSLISAKIGDDNGEDELSAIQAIEWAMNRGANVITGSFGWDATSELPMDEAYLHPLFEACSTAFVSGITLFFAAGNHGNCGYPDISIPAKFAKYDICCAVGSMAIGGQRVDGSGGSSWGPELSFVAPGGSGLGSTQIWSTTVADDYYGYKSGTSMAAPCAAGVGALIYSQALERGYELWDVDCKRIMEVSARDITFDPEHPEWCGPGWDVMTGYGCIDAYEALKHLAEPYEQTGGGLVNLSDAVEGTSNVTFTRDVTGQDELTGQMRTLHAGQYECRKHHLMGAAIFGPYGDIWAWGHLFRASPGLSPENPNDGWPWVGTDLPPGSKASLAVFETYVYWTEIVDTIYKPAPHCILVPCYIPRLPSNIAIEYVVFGKPLEQSSPSSDVNENSGGGAPPSLAVKVKNQNNIVAYYTTPSSQGQLDIYDVLGCRVAGIVLTASQGSVKFDLSTLPSGCYFARLCAGQASASARFVLVR